MPDIFATGEVDLKKLLNSEDHELISRIKSILGPFILRRLKSDVMQQLVPKTQHVHWLIFSHQQLHVLVDLPCLNYIDCVWQVNFVSMGSEQLKAYNGAANEYRAICEARTAKSSGQYPQNVVGLIPKRQISNYFMQLRKVSIYCDAKYRKMFISILKGFSLLPQIANHPLLIRRIYSDKDVERIARLTYPKGAFGFECSFDRAIQALKNYNDFAIHQVLLFLFTWFLLISCFHLLFTLLTKL